MNDLHSKLIATFEERLDAFRNEPWIDLSTGLIEGITLPDGRAGVVEVTVRTPLGEPDELVGYYDGSGLDDPFFF